MNTASKSWTMTAPKLQQPEMEQMAWWLGDVQPLVDAPRSISPNGARGQSQARLVQFRTGWSSRRAHPEESPGPPSTGPPQAPLIDNAQCDGLCHKNHAEAAGLSRLPVAEDRLSSLYRLLVQGLSLLVVPNRREDNRQILQGTRLFRMPFVKGRLSDLHRPLAQGLSLPVHLHRLAGVIRMPLTEGRLSDLHRLGVHGPTLRVSPPPPS